MPEFGFGLYVEARQERARLGFDTRKSFGGAPRLRGLELSRAQNTGWTLWANGLMEGAALLGPSRAGQERANLIARPLAFGLGAAVGVALLLLLTDDDDGNTLCPDTLCQTLSPATASR